MITAIMLLVGQYDPELLVLTLAADGVVFGALALVVNLYPPTQRVVHGFTRSAPGGPPQNRPFVIALQGRDHQQQVERLSVSFSEELASLPDVGGVNAVERGGDGDRRKLVLKDFPLRRGHDLRFDVVFASGDRSPRVRQVSVEPPIDVRDLSFLRTQAWYRVGGAAVVTTLLVVVGAIIAVMVVDPVAPVAGRILIASALIPIGFGFAVSRVLDRY